MRISDWSSDVCSSDLKGHDGVIDPYKALAKIKKQIASLNRAIAAAEKAGEDTGTMLGDVAAPDEQLSEAFGDLYDAVHAAWSTQAAAAWLLTIEGSNPPEVDNRGRPEAHTPALQTPMPTS